MRVLIIDNYDSFTYNLYQYVGEVLSSKLGHSNFEVNVKRNNEITLEEVKAYKPDRIIISPGPGTPASEDYFGVCKSVILQMGQTTPLMGVCLGMQGIAYCFGGNIIRADVPMHGKTSLIQHDGKGLYQNMPQNLEIMRYHSLVVETASLPDCLEITSTLCTDETATNNTATLSSEDLAQTVTKGSAIMGVRHKNYPIEGIQYHPESFATEGGKLMLENFLLENK